MGIYNLRKRDMLWVAPPLIIYMISELVRGQLGFNGVLFDINAVPEMVAAEETQRRIFFISATTVFITIASVVSAYAGVDLYRRYKPRQWLMFFITLLIICIGASITLLDPVSLFANSYEIFGSVDKDDPTRLFFNETLKLSHSGLPARFFNLFAASGIALIFGVAAVLFGAIGCLAEPEKLSETVKDNPRERLETYLFLSALLMVSGLVFYMSFMYWPSFILSDSPEQFKVYNDIVKNITIFTGITYSLMIAAFYIPMRKVLLTRQPDEASHASNNISAAAEPAGDNNTHPALGWIPKLIGTTKSQKEFYSYSFKIISPVLVAWLSTFLNLGGSLPS